MDKNIIESLLNEGESDYLDFKQEQYRFIDASDEAKSELLKDVLAFANAWRRTDAYILLGVREVKGKRSQVLGISQHMEDAFLQQFVNSKTQKPLLFSYREIEFDEKQIGIIHIPLQERPIYLKNNFGKLSKNIVYIRRGSSTAIAEPNEVAKMGAASVLKSIPISPSIDFEYGDFDDRTGHGKDIKVNVVNLTINEEIPNYRPQSNTLAFTFSNSDFYRELFDFYRSRNLLRKVCLRLNNSGEVTAFNARVEIGVYQEGVTFLKEDDFPNLPRKYNDTFFSNKEISIPVVDSSNSDLRIEHKGDRWFLSLFFGNVQPKAEAWLSEYILIGSKRTQKVLLLAKIFADNIPEPIQIPLSIDFFSEESTKSLKNLVEEYEAMVIKKT